MTHSVPARSDEPSAGRSARPVKSYRHGGIQMDVWKNAGKNGDIYNTTIKGSYKDEASGEWKESSSFSHTDLAIIAQMSSQAFQDISQIKEQSRAR